MKNSILIIFLILSGIISAQQKFLNITYDKVIMYEYDGGKEGDMTIVDDKGNFAKTLSAQVKLDDVTIKSLNSRLIDKKSFGAGEAFCYEPRLGFIYFLKKKIVGKIDICLACNRLRSSIDLKAQHQGKQVSDGKTYYTLEGMSPEFRNWLNELIKSKGFKFTSK